MFKIFIFTILLVLSINESFGSGGKSKPFLDINFGYVSSLIPSNGSAQFSQSGYGIGLQIGKYYIYSQWRLSGSFYYFFGSTFGDNKNNINVNTSILQFEVIYSFKEHIYITPFIGLGTGFDMLLSNNDDYKDLQFGHSLIAGFFIPLSKHRDRVFELQFNLMTPLIQFSPYGIKSFNLIFINAGIGYKF